jgi:aspartokinase
MLFMFSKPLLFQSMEVHKFGGTSVTDWRTLVALVNTFTHPCIIVVSAFSGVTDKLLESIDACRGVPGRVNRFEEISKLHNDKLSEMEAAGLRGNRERCDNLLAACGSLLHGVALISGTSTTSAMWTPSSTGHFRFNQKNKERLFLIVLVQSYS